MRVRQASRTCSVHVPACQGRALPADPADPAVPSVLPGEVEEVEEVEEDRRVPMGGATPSSILSTLLVEFARRTDRHSTVRAFECLSVRPFEAGGRASARPTDAR